MAHHTQRGRAVSALFSDDDDTGLGINVGGSHDDSMFSMSNMSVELGRHAGRRLSNASKDTDGAFGASPDSLSEDDGSSLPSLDKVPTSRSPVMQDLPLGHDAPISYENGGLRFGGKPGRQPSRVGRGFGPAGMSFKPKSRKSNKDANWDSLGDITGLSSVVQTEEDKSDGKRRKRHKEFMALKSVDVDTSDKLMFSAMNSLQKRINDLQQALDGANSDISSLRKQLVAKDTAYKEMERKARKYKDLARQYRAETLDKATVTKQENPEAETLLSPPKTPDISDDRLDALEEELRQLRLERAQATKQVSQQAPDEEKLDGILRTLKNMYLEACGTTASAPEPIIETSQDDVDVQKTLGNLQKLLAGIRSRPQSAPDVSPQESQERHYLEQIKSAVDSLSKIWMSGSSTHDGHSSAIQGASSLPRTGPAADLCRQFGLIPQGDDDDMGNETERPTQSNDDALGVVYNSLMTDYDDLLKEYRDISRQYASLDPTKDSHKRSDLLGRMDNVIRGIEQRSKPLYALGDVMISLNIPISRPEPVGDLSTMM